MEVEQEIPDHWGLAKIEDVVKQAFNGGTPKRSNEEYWGGEIDWLFSGEVVGKEVKKTKEKITQKGLDNSSAKLFPKSSVLVAMYGKTRGQSVICGMKMSGNQAICCLVPEKSKIRTEYLLYCFKWLRPVLVAQGRGGGQKNINQSVILEQKIPIPPLEEQDEIAETIDAQLRSLDSLIETITSLRSKTSEFEDSFLASIFAGRSSSSDVILGTPSIEGIPEHWEIEKLGSVANVNPSVNYSEDKDTYPHVPMDGVDEETQQIEYFSTRDSVYSGLARFEEGDILFARITPCMENGKVALVNELPDGEKMCFGSTEFAVIRTGEKLLQKYAYYYMASAIVRGEAKGKMTGATGRKRVPFGYLRNELQVPLPPLDEQQKIIEQVEILQHEMSIARQSIQNVQGLFDEYRASVLDYAIKGKLHSEFGRDIAQTRDDDGRQKQNSLSRYKK